jgi:hypothetical protein
MLASVSFALVAAALLTAQGEPTELDGAALTDVFTGASLRGCYPDGAEWHELTRADGTLFDQTATPQREVGSWWVENDEICYRYSVRNPQAGASCWTVFRDERYLYFVTSYGSVGAVTNCDDEPIV